MFDPGAKKEVFRLSQGVPRLINVICDRALLGAYARESRRINARLIRLAAAEVKGELQRSPWIGRLAVAASVLGTTSATRTNCPGTWETPTGWSRRTRTRSSGRGTGACRKAW